MDKDVREFVAEAERQGWRCELRRGGHWLCLAPDGLGKVTIAGTPGDRRWKAKTIARMRRSGFVWPRR